MTKTMTFWGAGPKFTLFSAIYCIIIGIVSIKFDPLFRMNFISSGTLLTGGSVLILAGLPFYILSLVTIKRAFKAGELVTKGTFGMCRHPVYSTWIVFFVPGIMLMLNTWIGLSAPVAMYVLVLLLVKEEEVYLEKTFGDDYLAYKKRVPAVLPVGRFKKSTC